MWKLVVSLPYSSCTLVPRIGDESPCLALLVRTASGRKIVGEASKVDSRREPVVELQLGLAELRVWTACSIDQRARQNGDGNGNVECTRLDADGSCLRRRGTGKAAGYIGG
jgi:hypothetical protein